MQVHMLTVGAFQSNCFIAACDDTREAVIIDACDEGDRILSCIRDNDLDVKMIVNTHAHIDHVSALPAVVKELAVPVLMHSLEMPLYEIVGQQAALFGLPAPGRVEIDRFIQGGDTISFGNVTGAVVETPGHSPGLISLVFADEKPPCVFVGDVIFQGSIGRTDLLGADHSQMVETLRNKIMTLPDDMIVYSGHGPETTIGVEKRSNPFLLELGS